ncbi:AraD1 family protein [Novosphingobium sp.]|uniref:AraD1 family protein n=1 Tax=Novosphingobium sp. TaxID=1874826 RepID=UPI0025EB0CC1|nr:AraD1 family protein [Novosphingobium sp.]
MIGSLVQFARGSQRGVAGLDAEGQARVIAGVTTTLDLVRAAEADSTTLSETATRRAGDTVDLAALELLVPIDTPEPTSTLVSGTGLTHLGSADGRDKMHKAAAAGQATDSMRMFLMGLEGGKPAPGEAGVQPEWFYKGDGSILVASGSPLEMPAFAEDGGEEPEIAGIYWIDAHGTPLRLGYVLGNEFSDHVVERQNYLWLAHSKLRQAALGPELRLGELPADVRGTSRIVRDGAVLWEKPFVSGEANMSHTIANLEHHHFKNALFRRPGMVHVHFFGTATLSCADGVVTRPGDHFEIEADAFRLGLRNPLARAESREAAVRVRSL